MPNQNDFINVNTPFICKSPFFSPRRFNITFPCSWYFGKKINDEEASDFLRSVFHELVHFHHLLGTTYGVYYYITAFTQLTGSFLSLKANAHNGEKINLPIECGILPVIKDTYEGFLDHFEHSESSSYLEKIDLDALDGDNVRVGVQEHFLYKDQRKTKEMISLQTMFYDMKFNTGKKINVPVGGYAIMENYAKHLEHTTGLALNANGNEYEKHFSYYFLTLHLLMRLKDVPDRIKNDLLSCIYYISLMGMTPLINKPEGNYFGILFKRETISPIETVKLMRTPGLIFYNALMASIEMSKCHSRALDDLDSFMEQLCDKMQLPNIYELNKKLKHFIELCLDDARKTSYSPVFPFIEYYLEMSLKFMGTIIKDPFSFAKGNTTKRLVSYLSDRQTDKNTVNGFMGEYPIPNIFLEHTYDNLGNVKEYTGMGDAGEEQTLLELYYDIYDQLFTSKDLYCYERRHLAATSETECKKIRDCGKRKILDYSGCTNTHKLLLKTIFGGYESLYNG